MNAKIDAFVEQIRKRPKFVAASATDPKWIAELDAIERGLNAIARKADDDSGMIDIFDKIQSFIGRVDLPIKQRLLEVGKLSAQARDAIKIVH